MCSHFVLPSVRLQERDKEFSLRGWTGSWWRQQWLLKCHYFRARLLRDTSRKVGIFVVACQHFSRLKRSHSEFQAMHEILLFAQTGRLLCHISFLPSEQVVKLQQREADHSSPFCGVINTAWSSTSTPTYVFIELCIITHRNYFTSGEIIPTRCNNCVYSSQWLYSTCFGWQFHPSSGAQCCIWPFR